MNSLTKIVNSAITSAIDQFATTLAEELGVEKADVLEIWNREATEDVKVTPTAAKKPAAPRKKAASSESESSVKKCQYVKTKGNDPGSKCGCKISPESKTGDYCTRHLAQEDPEKKAPKATGAKKGPAGKKVAAEKKESSSEVLKTPASAANKAIRRNKFHNYEDPNTGLVMDDTKTIIGRQNPDGTIATLTLEDIEICKRLQYQFNMPDNLTSKKEKDEDDNEEGEIEDDEEENEDDEEDEDEDA